jgi:O-antigen biosynthesis protein WbqV
VGPAALSPQQQRDYKGDIMGDIMSGAVSDAAEAASILGRPARRIELSGVRDFFRARSVLVAGAGGRIGSALCHAIADAGCRRLTGLDSDEHALVDLLASLGTDARARFEEALCTVRDPARLEAALLRRRPDVVVHAAAMKNITFCERHAAECVLTNLVGVGNMADAATASGASVMVFVSSDKAAAPSSLMGACMRLAELHLRWRDRISTAEGRALRFVAVRTGNVFGSRGSVVQTFRRQIATGGPVTLSHRAMRRYFMTVEEAVSLILMACATEATAGGAYLLDVGRPVLIRDLAARMIAHAGVEVDIVIGGAGDCEKFDEDLYDDFERATHSGVEGVLRLDSVARRPVTTEDIEGLAAIARSGDDAEVRRQVFSLLEACLGDDPARAARATSPEPAAPGLAAGEAAHAGLSTYM